MDNKTYFLFKFLTSLPDNDQFMLIGKVCFLFWVFKNRIINQQIIELVLKELRNGNEKKIIKKFFKNYN